MNSGNRIRILIADDHELVREGIKARLQMSYSMEICGEANSGAGAIEQDRLLDPDIIFLDISMPGMTGLEAAVQILQQSPHRKIMFLSIYDNPEYVSEALRIGAKGYLLKDVSKEEMSSAVQAVYNGGTISWFQSWPKPSSRQQLPDSEHGSVQSFRPGKAGIVRNCQGFKKQNHSRKTEYFSPNSREPPPDTA